MFGDKSFIGMVALILVLIVGSIIFSTYRAYGTKDTVTFTIEDKERVCEGGDSGCRYLVFTDEEVFENRDSFLHFKFNSSDIHGQLNEGEEYTATVIGWRIQFLSMYRNIIEVSDGL